MSKSELVRMDFLQQQWRQINTSGGEFISMYYSNKMVTKQINFWMQLLLFSLFSINKTSLSLEQLGAASLAFTY